MARSALTIPLLLTQLMAAGQSTVHQRDSVRLATNGLRSTIAHLDSSGPSEEAIEARLELAAMLKGKESAKLLEAAALLADSIRNTSLGIASRTALASRLSVLGNHKRAYAEMVRVIELRDQLDRVTDEQRTKEAANTDSAHQAEYDRLRQRSHSEIQDAQHRASGMQAMAERWMLTAIGLGTAWLITMVVLIIILHRQRKKTRADIQALRSEIEELKKPRNTFRAPVAPQPAEVVAPPPALPTGDQRPLRLPDDPMVSGMFLRQAPERLAAFKDARSRGDLEKAVRVVHTLKPTLVSIDDERFTALCARLVAPGAIGTAAWDSDADALSTAIEVLLGTR